jgi:hypothetical protein
MKQSKLIISAILMSILVLTGCNDSKETVAAANGKTATTVITTTVATTAAIPQIDCFEGVEITLSGISPDGKLTINKENASQDIRKWVSFSSDLSSGIHNGDTVVITASYNDGSANYTQTKEIVADLPFYITDISGYDLTGIHAIMDDAMDTNMEFEGYIGEKTKLQSNDLLIDYNIHNVYNDLWTPNNVSCEPIANYFAVGENGVNSYLRIYSVKINATKKDDPYDKVSNNGIEHDGYFYGETVDFELYLYISLYRLYDNDGIIQTESDPSPIPGHINIYGSIEDVLDDISFDYVRVE